MAKAGARSYDDIPDDALEVTKQLALDLLDYIEISDVILRGNTKGLEKIYEDAHIKAKSSYDKFRKLDPKIQEKISSLNPNVLAPDLDIPIGLYITNDPKYTPSYSFNEHQILHRTIKEVQIELKERQKEKQRKGMGGPR